MVVELFSTTFNYVPALFRHVLSFPYMFNPNDLFSVYVFCYYCWILRIPYDPFCFGRTFFLGGDASSGQATQMLH
ncbi:hypothetical protein I7I53_03285 [Histoplasma capsulatum var. duboisii H88]|uniref:Uncharacterized protein n=1 Tax=Ajellomyces capsulatus (strain H88) TaxID=544711 RepID=A0A8A1LN81_AJEC8|nr:hypothetical protein I7I53_03285 [Histoplasma capsulatum var. duboisii H88]